MAPMTWPLKSRTGSATQRNSESNSPSSKAMPARRTSAISRRINSADVIDFGVSALRSARSRKRSNWSGASAASMILPSAVQCAGRTTPTRSVNWKAPGPLVRASTTTASPMRTEKCALSPVSRDRSSSTGVARLDHLDLVERAGGERKQRPADAVALGVLQLPHIAERHHGLDQMEGRWNCAGRRACSNRRDRCRRGCGRSLP